ncbi:MAG: Lrp/AsnC family transcriptional regulator [Steroidobacteraceae bacterium]|nr:Lrp/AsnC family transcriptional regulator [Steroidobacteraceae bacterium]
MDRIDSKILQEIQADGRISIQDLARKVGLSASPCLRRLRMLEAAGVIRGYTAIVDEERFGLPVTAFVRLRLDRHSDDRVGRFERAIQEIGDVLECHVLAGDYDYMLRVLVADLKSYETFVRRHIHTIPGIAALETSFAYGTVKRAAVFPPRAG